MTLKDFAKSRSITLQKTKAICQAVLGDVPSNLDEDQMQRLDSNLAGAAQDCLPPAESQELVQVQDQLPVEQKPESQTVAKVREIIGVETLQKNALIYLKTQRDFLDKIMYAQHVMLFQFEQDTYQGINHTLNRMQSNVNALANSFTFDGLQSQKTQNQNSENLEMIQSVSDLLEIWGAN